MICASILTPIRRNELRLDLLRLDLLHLNESDYTKNFQTLIRIIND